MANDNENSNLVQQAINGIFGNNNRHLQHAHQQARSSKKGPIKDELRLALAVILVELASSDQNFDIPEYDTIAMGLKRVFGTTREEVKALVNQATVVLSSLRGTGKFAEMLAESLKEEEKLTILEIIDELITADGVVDGYEVYLRQKFVKILGIDAPPLAVTEKS